MAESDEKEPNRKAEPESTLWDAVGFAARRLGGATPAPSVARASQRSALKKVGGKSTASAQTAEPRPKPAAIPKAEQESSRADQAALGMLGKEPDKFNENEISEWLKQLSPEQFKKLNSLVWAARQAREDGTEGAGKFEKKFGQHGVKFDVHGGTVNVNIDQNAQKYDNGDYSSRKNKFSFGYKFHQVKDFINGH